MGSAFQPNEHLIQLRGKGGTTDYMPVQWRLVWLRDEHPDAAIDCALVELDREAGFALFRALVSIPGGGSAVGFGSETARDFGDYIEKASTKAVGRALAALGYGTQFVGDELDEGARVADTPRRLPNGAGPEQVQAVKEALAAKAAAGGKPPKLSQPMTVERALAIAGTAKYSPEKRQSAAKWAMDQANDVATIGQYHLAISQALDSQTAEDLANARLQALGIDDAPMAEPAEGEPWYDDPTVAPLLEEGSQS